MVETHRSSNVCQRFQAATQADQISSRLPSAAVGSRCGPRARRAGERDPREPRPPSHPPPRPPTWFIDCGCSDATSKGLFLQLFLSRAAGGAGTYSAPPDVGAQTAHTQMSPGTSPPRGQRRLFRCVRSLKTASDNQLGKTMIIFFSFKKKEIKTQNVEYDERSGGSDGYRGVWRDGPRAYG